jgi:FkbM family methyltransferase
MAPLLHALRAASHPLRRRIAKSIYTAPSLPEDMSNVSFSGAGEDLIALAWLNASGIAPPEVRYLDVGAAEPARLSNTFLFYRMGSSGVLVEPDPDQAALLRVKRPRDTVLNVGVAFDDRRSGKLKKFRRGVFNTFIDQQADQTAEASKQWRQPQSVVDTVEAELVPLNDIIEKHFTGWAPHFLSIDAEGCDFSILQSLDLSRYLPSVICLEGGMALSEYESILAPRGYHRICQTPDNILFWRAR